MLGQETVPDKANERAAIPVLLARLAEQNGLRGALVSIDAGADYLLAVKANGPSLRAKIEACFTAAPPSRLETHTEHDKGHGRTEQRTASIVRIETRIRRGEKTHRETRYYIASVRLSAEAAGRAVRRHCGIENRRHWVPDVTFNDDQSRLRKGPSAKHLAVVRHFALNLVRAAKDTRSVRLRRKVAGWTPDCTYQILRQTIG